MRLINVKAEIWHQNDEIDHIARCARVCYASDKTSLNSQMVDNLRKNNHINMFRHNSIHYMIRKDEKKYLSIRQFIGTYKDCPYVHYGISNNWLYITTNGQFTIENPNFTDKLSKYQVSNNFFNTNCPIDNLKRYTICVTTQISTTRELNRVSPNNIAEQSTRYVNFGKKGGIGIAIPHFYNTLVRFDKFMARLAWRIDEFFYNYFLNKGLKPQDAREFLPLCSYSKAVYTYTIGEWKHILDLRYFGTTGKPHPNAFTIASQIKELFEEEGIKIKKE